MGYLCTDQEYLIDEGAPLAIFCEYNKVEKKALSGIKPYSRCNFIPLSTPSKKKYKQKFDLVYEHLLRGDCYQVNLTMPTVFRLDKKLKPKEFVRTVWSDPMKISAYAHATYIHSLNHLLLSNSPECLFQVDGDCLRSMPIKGTKKVENEADRSKDWKRLEESTKDQGELYMISDLIRNDLAKLTNNPALVKLKKIPLHVPGLVHQFSLVESKLNKETNLSDIIKCLFPGGSITGAPKKRVMKIINNIEIEKRGFYCGSTVLLFKDIKTASINIRSIEVDYASDEIIYGAGGGVTLESDVDSEFNELMAKLKSFLEVLC